MNDTFIEKAMTPQKILQQRIKFEVPIYQRLFVWEQQQIEKLLDDLYHAWLKETNKPYFIGIITVNEKEGHIWEIVDGQQRLTFLTLFGALCIYKNFATSNNWKEFLFYDSNILRISYFGRKEDSDDINNLISSGPNSLQNLNFRYFVECFEKLNLKIQNWEEFSLFVFENTSFFISHLPSQYKPRQLNLFFEKMNSAGRQLTPVDLVKIQFANYANDWNACMNFDSKYVPSDSKNDESSEIISLNIILENTSNIEITQEPPQDNYSHISNQLIIKPEVFLLHVLKISKRKTTNKDTSIDQDEIPLDDDKLLETFAKFPIDEKTFIENMKAYRIWLDENIIYLSTEEKSSYTYAFRRDSESSNSVLEDSIETSMRSMRQFQSMLYVSSSDSQEWILQAYYKCRDDLRPLTIDLLRQQDWMRHPLPELSTMNYPSIARYWFWKLDFLLWEMNESSNNKNKLVSGYVFRRNNRSIEHLQPQANPFSYEIEHSFGNLALIAPGTNSSLNDNSINTKFGRIQDILNGNGHIESIKLLKMFYLARTSDEGLIWNEDKVTNHGIEMYKILEDDMKYYKNVLI